MADAPTGLVAEAEAALRLSDELVGQLWRPRFPSADLCQVAAGMIPSQPAGHGQEGPSWRIVVSPGAVKVRTIDEAKAERTDQRQRDAHTTEADMAAAFLAEDGQVPEPIPSRRVTEFSRRSVARMVETLCSLDYTPMFSDPSRLPAMVTLTYPGCWLPVASSGKAVKKHQKALRKRYERAFGETFRAVWKLEFQGRHPDKWCACEICGELDDGRAPHVHMLTVPPHHRSHDGRYFRQWLSETWAEIVAHPDPEQFRKHSRAGTAVDFAEGLRAHDPKRVAVYFTKHGLAGHKAYQHLVPQAWQEPDTGPGRFWGYWGLDKIEHVVSVSATLGTVAGRTLRRWSAAQQVTRETRRPRTKGGRAVSQYPDVIGLAGAQFLANHSQTRYRKTRTRAVRCGNGRGWVSVNDGASFATVLGLVLDQWLTQHHRDTDCAEVRRAGYHRDPLGRALALSPSPRRDALVERLQVRRVDRRC